jgi:PAS domain S-box-containing protein
MKAEHYLEKELRELTCRDPAVFAFLQSGPLAGLWYRDLEDPEQQWMSPHCWEMLGYDPASKQPLVSEWLPMIHPEDLPQAQASFDNHGAASSQPFDVYFRCLHKDGSTLWVRCLGLVLRDPAGRPNRLLGVLTDVTALKHAEEQARTLATQLQDANKELESFNYSVSHDLRAPLRVMDGFSRIVVKEYAAQLDNEGRRMLGLIRSEAQRMGLLLDDLLAVSRLSRQRLEPTKIDMSAMAQEVFQEQAAHEPTRQLRLDLLPLPPAYGSEEMIRKVWVKLLSNAIKFTKRRPMAEIEVGTEVGEDGGTVYYVKDNGTGFDMRHVSRLFAIFQRLHSADEFPGTGGGLALVKAIMQRHGGRVWAKGEVDQGATFYFALPPRPLQSQGGAVL